MNAPPPVTAPRSSAYALATAGGFVSLALWSGSLTVLRTLSSDIGPYAACAAVFLIAGAVTSVLSGGVGIRALRETPVRIGVCALLFSACICACYFSVAIARPEQVVAVGLMNQLWPVLTVVGSMLLLPVRVHWMVVVGLGLALGGIVALAAAPQVGDRLTLLQLCAQPQLVVREALAGAGSLPSLVAMTGACSWALYSLLSRRWFAERHTGTLPLYMLIVAVVMAIAAAHTAEREMPRWSSRVALLVTWQGFVPGVLSYALWERAMRRGNAVLVAATSCLSPVMATLIAIWLLHVPAFALTWVGCAAITIGSFICGRSVRERPPEGSSSPSA